MTNYLWSQQYNGINVINQFSVILGISSPSDITDAAKGLFDPVKLLRSGSGSGSGSGVDGGIGGGGGGGMGLGKGGTTSLLVSLFSEGAIITSFIGFVLGNLTHLHLFNLHYFINTIKLIALLWLLQKKVNLQILFVIICCYDIFVLHLSSMDLSTDCIVLYCIVLHCNVMYWIVFYFYRLVMIAIRMTINNRDF